MMEKKKVAFDTNLDRITLMRASDKRTLYLFIILFVASLLVYLYLITYTDVTVYTGLPVMAVPFFIIGLIYYFVNKRYYSALFIVVLTIVAFFLLPKSVLFILFLLVGSEGVAQMVEIIQRQTFYSILRSVERVNVKDKMTILDKVIEFFFNVPVDLDTRNLVIDRNITRNKLPWKDMVYSMMLALLFCMFLWIYVFLNPAVSLGTEGVPIYTFTIILYLAMLVMPWTIFNTFNVRISTDYRDFRLYSGFLETFKRMFLPVLAALLFLVIAVSNTENLYYVGMSLVMIVAVILFTSVMYYTSNEIVVVNDVLKEWDRFHPSTIYSDYNISGSKSSIRDDVPGTPRRNPADCYALELRTRGR